MDAIIVSNFTEAWDFDKTGNWTQYDRDGVVENRTHNAANEIQGIATHDKNGNMTVMPGLKAKYDAWNRLVEVKDSADNLIARYDYNGSNQRIKKTVGSIVTESFYNENWQELESHESGALAPGLTTFVWGQRYIDDLVLREKGQERLYSLADPNWNVVAVTDAAGNVVERMKYDAFGKVTWLDAAFTTKANSDYDWNRTFTGQVLDSETGLMLYRNRYYHTGLGRFVSRDPIEYDAEDVSLYRYVSNLPQLRLDPFGLKDHYIRIYIEESLRSKLPGGYLGKLKEVFNDCMEDHGCPSDELIVLVVSTVPNNCQNLRDGGLIGPNKKLGATGYYVGERKPVPMSRLGPMQGSGANYQCGLEPGYVTGNPDKAARAIAHELLEATFAKDIHHKEDHYIDSTVPAGGKFSPEGCKNLLKKLGIKTK